MGLPAGPLCSPEAGQGSCAAGGLGPSLAQGSLAKSAEIYLNSYDRGLAVCYNLIEYKEFMDDVYS